MFPKERQKVIYKSKMNMQYFVVHGLYRLHANLIYILIFFSFTFRITSQAIIMRKRMYNTQNVGEASENKERKNTTLKCKKLKNNTIGRRLKIWTLK